MKDGLRQKDDGRNLKPLRVLLVEDTEDDALLITRELRQGGFHPMSERVDTACAMTDALRSQQWDIVICDYSMSHFSALDALAIIKEGELDLPLIVVSGTITDDMAVAAMKSGASDYVMKDNLRRLVPAVERELSEAEVRRKRHEAEKKLRESEERYRSLVNNVGLGIFRSTPGPNGRFLEVNPAVEKITGYSREELLLMNVSDLFAGPTERQEVAKKVSLAKEKSTFELNFRRKDGTIIVVSDTKVPVRDSSGEVVYFDGILEDITDHKKTDEALQAAEQNFRNSLENSPIGIRIVTADGELLYANKAMLDIYGCDSFEELRDIPREKYYTRESYAEYLKRKEMRKRGEPVSSFEVSIIRKDGEVRHLEASAKEIVWDGKQQFEVLCQDVTEHKRAEEGLRQSEEKLRIMFETVPEGIVVTDLDARVLEVNEATLRLLGYARKEEFLGRSALEFVATRELSSAREKLRKTIEQGYSGAIGYALVRKDGSEFPAEVSAALLRDSSGAPTGLIAIVKDITERRHMEEQLVLTDRLASIGELASGVAHELNNPLTSVIGFSELLLERDVPGDIKEDLGVINREAHRTAQIVRNLLTFARKHEPTKQLANINKVIQTVLELRAYEEKVSNIKVITHFAPDLPAVLADSFQLQQVFLNIIINAEYFMAEAHGRGNLTVSTERVGGIVRASFTDDGPGIPEENLPHIFDPFFTTKEVGKGTGLGLSICYGIVTAHGGNIHAESELGHGATFIVELPIKQERD